MRITPEHTKLITDCVHHHFGDVARIWLFGSRTSDDKRGGDIDLYVEAAQRSLMRELHCKHVLEDALDEPVDLIVRAPGDASAIALIAKAEGIAL